MRWVCYDKPKQTEAFWKEEAAFAAKRRIFMNHSIKRLLSLVLAAALVCTLLPAQALAITGGTPEVPSDRLVQTLTTDVHYNPLYEGIAEEIPAQSPEIATPASETEYVDEQTAADQLRAAMVAREGSCVVSFTSTNEDHDALMASLFFDALSHTGDSVEGDYLVWQYGSWRAGSSVYSEEDTWYYTSTFTFTYYTTAEQEAQMDTAVAELLTELSLADSSDYEKVKGVYDYICANVTYDYDNLEDTTYLLKHTAYAALMNGTAVCQGYALLFYRLMLELGVDCRLVAGLGSGEAHGWNIVALNGRYYNVDSTWDAGEDVYSWFLLSEESFVYHVRGDYSSYNGNNYSGEEFAYAYPMSETDYFSCGEDLTWSYSGGHLTITGTGAMTDFEKKGAPWYEYCAYIESVSLPEGLTSIGNYAFLDCEELTAVSIPEGVTRIGDRAFDYCENLTDISLPDSLTEIGDYAFHWCLELHEITLPDGLETIGAKAFWCDDLWSIVIPDSVTSLGSAAFATNHYLSSATLSKNLTVIPDSLFSGCWYLEDVVIPEKVTSIEAFAFSGCYYMDEINIPESVSEICSGAFTGCSALQRIVIPYGIKVIQENTFNGCSALESVQIPESVTEIGRQAFYKCGSLQSLALPSGLTSIGERAFYDSALIRMSIPDGVTSIGKEAFGYCEALTQLELPDSLTEVSDLLISNTAVTKLVIPESVTRVAALAFWNADALTKIVFQGDAPVFGANGSNIEVFSGLTLTAYYPENNDTWTEEVMQDYAGTVTWICGDGAEEEVEQPADDLSWSVVDGILTISGNGGMGDYTQTTMPWYDYRDQVTAIVIEEGITSIGDWAFCGFSYVTSVSVPTTITRIGTYAFYNADGLTELPMSGAVTEIEAYAFHDCAGLSGVLEIPGTVLSIGKYAFADCSGVEAVILNEGVETVGEGAFSGCTSMKQFIFYDSVTELGANVLGDCTSLLSVTAGQDNTAYAAQDGVLFNKAMTSLIHFPAGIGGDYTVPATVTAVGNHAFRSCSLQWVAFQGDAPSFGKYAFYNTTATIRYPISNDTWTDDVKQDYGGTLSWMGIDTREATAAQVLTGNFRFVSNLTMGEAEYPFTLDENWLLASSKTYNHDLARMSIRMAMSAAWTTSDCIEDLFDSLGLTEQVIEYPAPTMDTIGYAIGSKKLTDDSGEVYTLIAVAVRGGGYGSEWGSNFIVNTGIEHAGFWDNAEKVYAGILEYITNIGADENIRIWITGYSRAAAVSNLTAHRLNKASNAGEIPGLDVGGIFAYCFECPAGVKTTSDEYSTIDQNIFNIVNPVDIVPMMAPLYWDYSRYGITYFIPSSENTYNGYKTAFAAMQEEYGKIADAAGLEDLVFSGGNQYLPPEDLYTDTMLRQNGTLTNMVATLAHVIGGEANYAADMQDTISQGLATLCGSDSDAGEVLKFALEIISAIDGPENVADVAKNALTELAKQGVNNVAYAHYQELCLAWMDSLEGASNYSSARSRNLLVNCPVDIAVYDSQGTLVASIVNDEVQEIEGSTICALVDENGQKVVILPLDEEFEIIVTATDDGTMSYQVEEYDILSGEATRIVNYCDVVIAKGDTFTGTAGSGTDAEYSLTGETELTPDNELTGDQIGKFTVTVSAEGNGTVTGGGLFTTGEYAMVTAKPDEGEEFLGWYVKDVLVSSDAEYRFRVEADTDVLGKFTVQVHEHKYDAVTTEPTCTEQGYTTHTCTCGDSYVDSYVDALGHKLGQWTTVKAPTCTEDGTQRRDCERCDHYETVTLDKLGHQFENGVCARCGEPDPDYVEPKPTISGITRIFGDNRYLTSFGIANQLKETLGVEKFQTIIVAYGQNFPDALTGSYLAAVKDAPILLTENKKQTQVIDYIAENLAAGGTVYILGGVNAIPSSFETALSAKNITAKRLAGDDRYQTNLKILEEAGVSSEQEILICTGNGFADSLSASAAGLPILLVGKELKAEQKEFLVTTSGKFVIIGGTSAVSSKLESELKSLGSVSRLGGETRYETSVLVAQRFVQNPGAAILAYAKNFPDGLCGGPLAYALGAPLILTDTDHVDAADAYIEGISSGIVVGGPGLISDTAVRNIFDLSANTPITVK